MEPFINACKDEDFQAKQIVDFIKRLESAINKKPTGYTNKIKDFVKSKLGKALVLDHDVNRPGHVSNCFADALNEFFLSNKKVSKSPSDWSDKHNLYERNAYIKRNYPPELFELKKLQLQILKACK